MSKRSKACDINQKVKKKVWERDNHRCIICGSPYAMPNAHFIPRSQGGLGIEENIVTLCLRCHNDYDNGNSRVSIGYRIEWYLNSCYQNWNKENLIYKKY
jgi:5-methylcytosine-specific restriction endonuclease McrA